MNKIHEELKLSNDGTVVYPTYDPRYVPIEVEGHMVYPYYPLSYRVVSTPRRRKVPVRLLFRKRTRAVKKLKF